MTSEEFWKDDPQLFVSYRTSFINKKKREKEELDYKCWLQGLYIHDGNGKLFMSLKQFIGNILASMFKGSKDNSKIDTYPSKPYGELEKEENKNNKEKDKKQKYEEYENSLAYFGTLKKQYLDKLSKKGE
ncbi:MAG: hypothetical protein IKU37_01290 [Candidatus Gastranaerophilales bacterium]|nr:hypothetical protein [Candidatus Gastranaerophilales bacterium]